MANSTATRPKVDYD
jgi:hypothetical protein